MKLIKTKSQLFHGSHSLGVKSPAPSCKVQVKIQVHAKHQTNKINYFATRLRNREVQKDSNQVTCNLRLPHLVEKKQIQSFEYNIIKRFLFSFIKKIIGCDRISIDLTNYGFNFIIKMRVNNINYIFDAVYENNNGLYLTNNKINDRESLVSSKSFDISHNKIKNDINSYLKDHKKILSTVLLLGNGQKNKI